MHQKQRLTCPSRPCLCYRVCPLATACYQNVRQTHNASLRVQRSMPRSPPPQVFVQDRCARVRGLHAGLHLALASFDPFAVRGAGAKGAAWLASGLVSELSLAAMRATQPVSLRCCEKQCTPGPRRAGLCEVVRRHPIASTAAGSRRPAV